MNLKEKIKICQDIGLLDENNNLIEQQYDPDFLSRATDDIYLKKERNNKNKNANSK